MKKIFTFIIFSSLLMFISCATSSTNAIGGQGSYFDTVAKNADLWHITGDDFAHDPTIIKTEDGYWEFFTANGISCCYSKDGKVWSWRRQVFSESLKWWKNYVPTKTDFNIWAPEIIEKDGKYYLYYSISTFGSRVSCIGLVTCEDLKKPKWVDEGLVINSNNFTPYNAIDPAIVEADGIWYMAFGSWSEGLYIVELDNNSMKPIKDAKPQKIASRNQAMNAIEGCCIWNPGNGWYYLFASYDKCCAGINSTYNIRYGRSKTVTGPFIDEDGKDMLFGGGTYVLASKDHRIGPGGQSIFKTETGWAMAYHYYNKIFNGRATLSIFDLQLDENGWLKY